MARIKSIQITNASLSLSGLLINCRENGIPKTFSLCPKATCQLLADLNQIEDFEIDANGEPVILFTDENAPRGFDGEQWHMFVQTYHLSNNRAEILAGHLSDKATFARDAATITRLLQPLKSVA
ncbi:MAG: hypothetical protein V4615_07010 [Bacteroidota bacterium]